MSKGISYDSDEGRSICAAITSLMTGTSYATSAEIAGELGPFPGYAQNSKHMLELSEIIEELHMDMRMDMRI
jgi:ribonucleoside-diphosphate reductase alpha chain